MNVSSTTHRWRGSVGVCRALVGPVEVLALVLLPSALLKDMQSCHGDEEPEYAVDYDCPSYSPEIDHASGGGVVMEICGMIDGEGKLQITARKRDGTSLGS